MRLNNFFYAMAFCAILCQPVLAEDVASVQPVKNIILMIPDGCSLATYSTARWYQWYLNPEKEHLNIDPYICGTVRTTCSNAPIGDSAPTTSTYMTGYNSLRGWVATYPTSSGKNDIYPMDTARAYQPLTTLMEAAKILQGKSTGLVCTCTFCQATPADCSAHNSNRNDYRGIVLQQAHNNIDVVIGGGIKNLDGESESYLKNHKWEVLKNDLAGMRSCKSNKMWALFGEEDMSHDLDRDPSKEPSLAEMTQVAIDKLSTNKKGFVMMVEGSQVDFCAHANDPIGMVTELLAFDEACKVAIDFAKKNKETAVVILSDHGNSGLSIGRRDWGNYAGDSKERMFSALAKCKATADEMVKKLNKVPAEDPQELFEKWYGFKLSDKELEALNNCKEYTNSPVPADQRKKGEGSLYSGSLSRMIAQFLTSRTGLAFTTGGHTGEDVLLSAYHPNNASRPYGMLTNIELNHYLCNVNGFTNNTLDSLTNNIFVPHTEVFKGMEYTIADRVLTVKNKNKTLQVKPNTNIVVINGKEKELESVVVYVGRKNTFYLPRKLKELL